MFVNAHKVACNLVHDYEFVCFSSCLELVHVYLLLSVFMLVVIPDATVKLCYKSGSPSVDLFELLNVVLGILRCWAYKCIVRCV